MFALEQQRRDDTLENRELIDLRITELSLLFHAMDPSPPHEKDLDPKVEEFIVSWARAAHRDSQLALQVHVDQPAMPEQVEMAREAIHEFFRQRSLSATRRLSQLFRVGRTSLLIGVLFLSVVASQTIARKIEPRPLGKVIEESLLIFAWVANWRPIEIFFYEWWPIVRRRDLYRRLGEADVELRPYRPGDERRLVLPKQ